MGSGRRFRLAARAVDRAGSSRSDDELAKRLSPLQLLPLPGVATVELEEPLELARDRREDPRGVSAHVDRAQLEPAGEGWRLTLYERGREHVLQVGSRGGTARWSSPSTSWNIFGKKHEPLGATTPWSGQR